MRGRSTGRTERAFRQPADVAVGIELAPRPAFTIRVVDRDALALERLGEEQRVGPWRAAHRRLRLDHLTALALDKARRRDLASQVAGREIGTGRRDA